MRASDGRGQTSLAVVTVTVAQDQKPPVFDGLPYNAEPVSENIANYSVVFTLRGRDPDLKVWIIVSQLWQCVGIWFLSFQYVASLIS